MYDDILVPTDGSQSAERAAAHAGQLASAFDATVHLLAVVDVDAAAGPFSAGGVDEAFVDRLEDAAAEHLEEAEGRLDIQGTIHTDMRRGQPVETIMGYIGEGDIELVAMGTHGRTGFDRFVTGSVSESVLRQSPVPVLTTTAESEARGGYDEVLIPTDSSEAAEAAVDHGLAVATAFDARVHALYIVDLGALSAGAEYPLTDEILATLRDVGEEATGRIVDRAESKGLEAVAELREEFPARGVLDYIESADIDLVTMGTTGQTGLSRVLLGSTTERVVRHASVPILAVNARTQE